MMELLPQRGIYVYPKDIRIAGKKESGTAMARFLMSIFYTNEELIERGNLMGKNGKRGLDKKIVDAIVGKTNNHLTKFFFNEFFMWGKKVITFLFSYLKLSSNSFMTSINSLILKMFDILFLCIFRLCHHQRKGFGGRNKVLHAYQNQCNGQL